MKEETTYTNQLQYLTRFLYAREKWIDENL